MAGRLLNAVQEGQNIPTLICSLSQFALAVSSVQLSLSVFPLHPLSSLFRLPLRAEEKGSSAMQTQQQPRSIWPISVSQDMSDRAGSQSEGKTHDEV